MGISYNDRKGHYRSLYIHACPYNPWNSVWSYHLQNTLTLHPVSPPTYRPEQVLFNGDCNFFQFFFVCLFFNFNVYRFIVICSYDWDYSLHYLQMNIYNALQLFLYFFPLNDALPNEIFSPIYTNTYTLHTFASIYTI